MSKNRKKTNNSKKNVNTNNRKQTKSAELRNAIIAVGVLASVILIVMVSYIIYGIVNPPSGLEDTQWKSISAYDASDDEVDIDSVYNNYYASYQGSMSFKSDGRFTFWMGPGDPDDGTHKGNYKYNKDDTIDVVFDNGEKGEIKVVRNKEDSIIRIEVPYNGYTVHFEK